MPLAAACNPNVIEMLYVAPESVLDQSLTGGLLWLNRHLFLSQRARKALTGYALNSKDRYRLKNNEGKALMHYIRSLRVCLELFLTGELNILRQDREELLAIRNGKISLEEVDKMGADLLEKIAATSTTLPPEPDYQKLEKLNKELIELYNE